jgi:hypothetical protein
MQPRHDMPSEMLDKVLCIDFEASSLENGYPIEVGIADAITGRVRAWLIRPPVVWAAERVWSPASAAVHGISRAMLDTEGAAPGVVWRALARAIKGRRLVSDNPPFDGRWLNMLAGMAQPALLDLDQFAWALAVKAGRRPDIAWRKAETEVWTKVPTVHRAGPDALRNALMLRHIAGKT